MSQGVIMLGRINGQLQAIGLGNSLRKTKKSFVFIAFYGCIIPFVLYCTSYDNKVKYFRKDIPAKKVDRNIKISPSRSSNSMDRGKVSYLPYDDYGFTVEDRSYTFGEGIRYEVSDFVIEHFDNSRCTELFPVLTLFSLALIPNYENCKRNSTITSYYKQQKRKQYEYNMEDSTFIHLFVLWGLFLNNKEHAEEFSVFKKTALTDIHNDFSAIQEEDEKNQNLKEEENIQAIEDITKSQKIKMDEFLDLRDESTRKEFLLAWYNSKENPDIENNISYSENEFKYQEDKKKFNHYRKYKYAITDSYWIAGDYDFKKNAYNISQTNHAFITSRKVKGDFTGTVTRLLEMKTPLNNSDTIKSHLSFSIVPEKAEKFKNEKYEYKNVIILSKFSPASFVTTGKCKYPDEYYEIRDDEYKECKERFENRQIKFKYLLGEPLKYRIVYDGEVYKNY